MISTPRAQLRVGDAEREAAINALNRHFAEGRLSQTEHDERTSAALTARTYADLDRLFTDLPVLAPPLPARVGVRASASDALARLLQGGLAVMIVVMATLMVVGRLSWVALFVLMVLAARFTHAGRRRGRGRSGPPPRPPLPPWQRPSRW